MKGIINIKQTIKNPAALLNDLFSIGRIKTGMFTGSMTFVLKFMIEVMRWARKRDDGFNGFVAGCLAGYISLFFLSTPKKNFIVLSLFVRALDCIYNSLAAKGYY